MESNTEMKGEILDLHSSGLAPYLLVVYIGEFCFIKTL